LEGKEMEEMPKEEIERIEKEKGFARRLKILMTISSLNSSRGATIFSVTGKDIEKVTGYSLEVVWYELLQLKNEDFVHAIYPTGEEPI
jgi:PP-loop superfamily ATP-utilizing enzyme